MARRKNTAECREVLRKVFENEVATGGEDAAGADSRQPAQPGQSVGGARASAATNRIAGLSPAHCEPLLGEQQDSDSAPMDRHGAIRSSAPGAGPGDRGGGFSGGSDHPGGDRFASNVSDYVEEPVVAGLEAPEAEASCEGDGVEGEAAGGEDLVIQQDQETGGGELEPEDSAVLSQEDGFPGDESLYPVSSAGNPAGEEAAAGTFSRFRSWILRDDSRGVFGKPVQVKASTLVIVGLSVAIVVGLLGLYFKIEPQEGRLAGRILDDRMAAQAGDGMSTGAGGAAATAGVKPAARTSANIPGKGSNKGSNKGAGKGLSALARPVWSRQGGQRPPVRNIAPVAPAQPAAGFVTTEATRWLRVRDLMGKEECAKLLDHLKKLQEELRERGGCKDSSVACKELKNRMRKRHGEDLYAVDIGPFASWSLAQQASAELKKVTRRAPWVFRDKPEYFSESYPRKP